MVSKGLSSCVLFLLIHFVCGNVPVLLWESSKSDRINSFPALHRISSEDFQQYMKKKIHGEQHVPLIAVFSEESLSMEDFSWQDAQGQGYFPQLKNITETADNLQFLTSVQNSVESVEGLSRFNFSLQHIDSEKAGDLTDVCGKILIISLPEANPDEDRPELLRRHDVKIAELYSQLLSKCSHVIALLSGQQSSWVEPEEVTRVRRSTDDQLNPANSSSQGPDTLYQDSNGIALLYSTSQPKLTLSDGKEITLGNYSVFITGDNSKPSLTKLFAKYGTDYRLTFNFDNKTYGYWRLQTVDLTIGSSPEIVLRSTLDITAPLTKSYHCGTPVTFRNGTNVLTFSNLQVQPFFLMPGSKSFGDAVDAVEFFTPAIWSGLFVTFLLAIIFTWGMSMIMDIRTMDQFDDPKGKTITVSATE